MTIRRFKIRQYDNGVDSTTKRESRNEINFFSPTFRFDGRWSRTLTLCCYINKIEISNKIGMIAIADNMILIVLGIEIKYITKINHSYYIYKFIINK